MYSEKHPGSIFPIRTVFVENVILELLQTHPRQLNPSDICILVGRHNQASKIRDGLALAGLPSRLVTQGDILTSDAAQILQKFINAIARPEHIVSLKLVACSPLMQWSAKKFKTAAINGEFDQLAAQFQYWAKNFSKLGVMNCLSELLESRIIANLSTRGRLFADLQQCSELVQEAIHLKELDAWGAAKWLKHQRLQVISPIPNNRQPHSDLAESSINVVTIHRSKGLEYKVVICPYLWQSPPLPKGPLWRSEETQNWNIAINKDWGLRDLESVKEIARKYSFENQLIIQMPSNNISLILRKY